MAENGKIIVATTLTKEYRGDVCVAHIPQLGLSGYGKTMDEAERSVKELFNNLISEYRRLGVLEEQADQPLQSRLVACRTIRRRPRGRGNSTRRLLSLRLPGLGPTLPCARLSASPAAPSRS